MTLGDYLKHHGLSDVDFATRVKCDRTTVMRWRKGQARPKDLHYLEAVRAATNGEVTPNDFFPQVAAQ